MFLELINDVFMSSSVFYIYFGMLLLTIGFSQLFALHLSTWNTHTNWSFHHHQHMKVDGSSHEKPISMNEIFIIWFVKSFKRIDGLDDDQEDVSNSYFDENLQIRGGQLWKKTTYSQPFGNIAFLF